jgi:hypothetical protein
VWAEAALRPFTGGQGTGPRRAAFASRHRRRGDRVKRREFMSMRRAQALSQARKVE